MRLSIAPLTAALLLAASQQESRSPRFDPFANPVEEMVRRAERTDRQKRFDELQLAADELAAISKKISEEIARGGQNVVSVKVLEDLDKAEKLLKTMREKAK
jgi:hypothetical protein